MIEINDDNVLELLEQSITEYGGQECTYADRVINVYNDQGKAEIVTGDCYYFTPGDPVNIDEDGDIEWRPMEPQPLCLVGCLFAKVGVPAKVLYDSGNNSSSIGQPLADLLLKHDVSITKGALRVLQAAQRRQDNAKSWGDALNDARYALNATEGTSNA
jgi:hypothetical protein